MRKVIYSTMVSLDGFTTDQNQSLEWIIIDEEIHNFVNAQHHDVDTFLFGRRMYDVMQAWDTIAQEPSNPEYILEFARIWQGIHKIVFSKTLEHVPGNVTLSRGDIAAEVVKLKAQPGKALSVGGATIAAALMRSSLIDEYHLFVNPVILGGGTPMFPASGPKTSLQLLETRLFRSGVCFLRYSK